MTKRDILDREGSDIMNLGMETELIEFKKQLEN